MVHEHAERRLPRQIASLSRRCRLMLDVTCQILRNDPELRLCEGLRLIEATRTAISRFAPETLATFDADLAPHMRAILLDRFGVPPLASVALH